MKQQVLPQAEVTVTPSAKLAVILVVTLVAAQVPNLRDEAVKHVQELVLLRLVPSTSCLSLTPHHTCELC